ncbi:hypothetical protein N7519_005087 [Penicillium mononematosum]|uniref:uncharacterized protein n=1 Tax=Penicillium mononematosum TaxID=268346 RepID=UPI0025490310|nr:uncharacterized protein N7519_005087 [Penicillium mononematosum]KAJ6183786.1 hypothetical protein N7519_005087 [Penicillium mononematosum]
MTDSGGYIKVPNDEEEERMRKAAEESQRKREEARKRREMEEGMKKAGESSQQRRRRGVRGYPEVYNVEDKAGVMAMVCSLICQLLQFQPSDDKVYLQPEMLDRLTQPGERWTTGLLLLKYLLENTPCGTASFPGSTFLKERDCQKFNDLLFAHVRNIDWPFWILFTTSGFEGT